MRYLGRLKILPGRPRSRVPLGCRAARAAQNCCPNPALSRALHSTLNLGCPISKSATGATQQSAPAEQEANGGEGISRQGAWWEAEDEALADSITINWTKGTWQEAGTEVPVDTSGRRVVWKRYQASSSDGSRNGISLLRIIMMQKCKQMWVQ